MKIQIDKLGKILEGDDKGYYVKIIDDAENTGGFLILTSSTREMNTGFDAWVKDRKGLEEYFLESNWLIAWL